MQLNKTVIKEQADKLLAGMRDQRLTESHQQLVDQRHTLMRMYPPTVGPVDAAASHFAVDNQVHAHAAHPQQSQMYASREPSWQELPSARHRVDTTQFRQAFPPRLSSRPQQDRKVKRNAFLLGAAAGTAATIAGSKLIRHLQKEDASQLGTDYLNKRRYELFEYGPNYGYDPADPYHRLQPHAGRGSPYHQYHAYPEPPQEPTGVVGFLGRHGSKILKTAAAVGIGAVAHKYLMNRAETAGGDIPNWYKQNVGDKIRDTLTQYWGRAGHAVAHSTTTPVALAAAAPTQPALSAQPAPAPVHQPPASSSTPHSNISRAMAAAAKTISIPAAATTASKSVRSKTTTPKPVAKTKSASSKKATSKKKTP